MTFLFRNEGNQFKIRNVKTSKCILFDYETMRSLILVDSSFRLETLL